MADPTETELAAALEAGRVARRTEPRAVAARYDAGNRRIVVDLNNGCTFAFPPAIAQGLAGATDDELASVEILGEGYGLHWEALDTDFTVGGLLAGVFGTRSFMAGQAGRTTSPAKAAAARANGAKGGRPRKRA